MLMRAERCTLLMVDVQEKLLPHMHEAGQVLGNCLWLVRVALRLKVPVVASEQYPQSLGPTVAPLREALEESPVIQKADFSCVGEQRLMELDVLARPQIVVAGMETHVCVLQTAMELRALRKEVFVVADAVSSRTPANRDLGLARMREAGIQIVSREMAAFEWLERAGTPLFREVSRGFLR
jgi:nicotinamidase-related amidase